MLEKLNEKEFDAVFELLEISFPEDEYRTYEEQKRLMEHPAYTVYVYKDDGESQMKGCVCIWEFETLAYIEHLVVDPSSRNGGIGAKILKELSARIKKRICLEVELPENETAVRRIGFYQRNGFFLNEYPYVQPPLSKGKQSLPLFIMTSKSTVSETEFEEIRKLLYAQVYRVKQTDEKQAHEK